MKNLKAIIGNSKRIWIHINKEDFPTFLKYANDNNCTWGDGRKINLNKEKFSHYISINSDLELSYVPAYCWYINADNSPTKFKFKEIIGEK